ncbi:hypothetical protein BDZ91DRAFT_708348 [Kalaharituber pfeilii]|nr:hypothetical protein BDZ91DRAFT_708348 [Kalaharituber pfeilii]
MLRPNRGVSKHPNKRKETRRENTVNSSHTGSGPTTPKLSLPQDLREPVGNVPPVEQMESEFEASSSAPSLDEEELYAYKVFFGRSKAERAYNTAFVREILAASKEDCHSWFYSEVHHNQPPVPDAPNCSNKKQPRQCESSEPALPDLRELALQLEGNLACMNRDMKKVRKAEKAIRKLLDQFRDDLKETLVNFTPGPTRRSLEEEAAIVELAKFLVLATLGRRYGVRSRGLEDAGLKTDGR